MSARLELLRPHWAADQPNPTAGEKPDTNLTLLAQVGEKEKEQPVKTEKAADDKAADKAADKPAEPTVRSIRYDDGRNFEFTVSPEGKLTKMTVDGRVYTRRGDSDTWDYQSRGQVGQWFGQIRLNDDGSYTYTARGSTESTTVKTTGAVETTYQNGSAVELKNDKPVSVKYPDNSRREFLRDNAGNLTGVKEPDGTTWTAGQNGIWTNDRNAEQRTAVQVAKDGTVSFTDAARTQNSIDRSARITQTRADGSTIESVGDQIQKLRRVGGTRIDVEYKDGQVSKVTIDGNSSYTKKDGTADEWTFRSGTKSEPWKGTIDVTRDGACVYTIERDGVTMTDTYSLDNKRHQRHSTGATVEFDASKRPLVVTRPNGSRIECEYTNDKLTKITEVSRTGAKNTWEKSGTEDRWYCKDFIGTQRMNLAVDEFGKITWESVGGTKFATDASNINTRVRTEGTHVRFDADVRISEVTLPNKTTLTCGYTDGAMTSIVEKTQAGATTATWTKNGDVWTAPEKPGESRRNFVINADGEYVFVGLTDNKVTAVRHFDGSGRKFEYDGDALKKVIETPRSGASTTWERQGATDEWSNGTRRETRKAVDVTNDGVYSFQRGGLRHNYPFDGTEDVELPKRLQAPDAVEKEGRKLWDVISQEFPQEDRTPFRRDMEAFHRRAALHQVPDAQVAKTFDEIRQLIQANDANSTIKKEARLNLAKEILHHVAYPRAIDQGWHETCNVATVQVVTATRQPDKFAGIVRQIATTGGFKTTTNSTVNLDSESLKPDWQARWYKPYDPLRSTYARSYASQLFQVGAINAYYSTSTQNTRYEQRVPTEPKDTGERLVNTANGAIIARVPNLTCDNMLEIGRQIGSPLSILESTALQGTHNTTRFGSEQQLSTHLANLQRNNQLPAIIMVHTGQEPYWSENGAGRGGTNGGWHVVTIWDVDANNRVLVDNQWGRRADHEGFRRMTMTQLYNAGQPRP